MPSTIKVFVQAMHPKYDRGVYNVLILLFLICLLHVEPVYSAVIPDLAPATTSNGPLHPLIARQGLSTIQPPTTVIASIETGEASFLESITGSIDWDPNSHYVGFRATGTEQDYAIDKNDNSNMGIFTQICRSVSGFAFDTPIAVYNGGTAGIPRAVIGCCKGSECHLWRGVCVDWANYVSNTGQPRCTGSCKDDTRMIVCTDPATPFCQPASFPQFGATIWDCTEDQSLGANYTGTIYSRISETDRYLGWEPVVSITPGYTSLIPRSFVLAEYVSAAAVAMNFSSPISAVPSRTSAVPIGSGPSGTISGGDKNGGGGGNNVPIGAIVGGAVGGVAVLGALGFGIIWLVLRERRLRRRDGMESPPIPPPVPEVFQVVKPELPGDVAARRAELEARAATKDVSAEPPSGIQAELAELSGDHANRRT